MSKLFFLLTFLLTFSISAQEICNNGIDDDFDGLIDINDQDCQCFSSENIPSLITNSSFELYNICPNSFSQMSFSQNWIQATSATSDYFNTCGYVPNPTMLPFPDGQAAVGGYFCSDYKEYIGSCLSEVINAGTEYTLRMKIASAPSDIYDLSMKNNGIISYGSVDITIYGNSSCASLPVNTSNCITEADPSWFVLGYATYTPSLNWEEISITFTSSVDINSVIIGSPCELSADYPEKSIMQTVWGYYPYFYYDDLTINRTLFFNPVTITESGDSCTGMITLNSIVEGLPEDYLYQWYKNGIAIIGATSATLQLVSSERSGFYSLMVSQSEFCSISNIINVQLFDPINFTLTGNCLDADYILKAISDTELLEGNITYQWKNQNGNLIGDNTQSLNITSIINSSFETEVFPQEYTLIITNSLTNCEYFKSTLVNSIFCIIPKGISPDGNNANDYFDLTGLNVKHIDIFNRYGMIVYSKENYTNQWNGKSDCDKELPDGTYYYHIVLQSGNSKTGWVYLLRSY